MSGETQLVPAAPTAFTLPEELTRQFYAWEQRGRGWQVWEEPVELEPPFRPCFYYLPYDAPDPEAGRQQTWLSRLAGWFGGAPPVPSAASATMLDEAAAMEPLPEPDFSSEDIHELELVLPPGAEIPKAASEHLILNLNYASGPVSFEVIGTADTISVQYACRQRDARQLHQQLSAHAAEGVLRETEYGLAERWHKYPFNTESIVVDFGLSHEFVRPLRTFRTFTADPLTGAVAALSQLQRGETAVLQILFAPVRSPWAQSIFHSVTDREGGSFFMDAPDMVGMARNKISLPLYAAVVRVAAQSETRERSMDIARDLGGALAQYGSPASNELVPLTNDGYPDYLHEQDLLHRQSRRSGMILNTDELVGLVHPPSPCVQVEKFDRLTRHTRAVPSLAQGHSLVLGENIHNGETVTVSLSGEQRCQHLYCVGASGTGKSTFLLNLITQDIEAGRGVAVLDPHGDLIDECLARIPESRHQDMVLFDPSDEDYPIGFNILSAHSELEKNLIASDLVAMFRRLSTSWGDQMTTVFNNAILAMLESTRGATLADLRRFLVEKSFRADFLKSVPDRELVYYWEKEFPMLSGRPQGPILTRLDAFLRPKLIRHMVSQQDNKLDFAEIMNSGKIFLAKLSQGAIGEENSYLLGALLVSKFHQITLSRQEMQASQRNPFFLFIDEFHNFVTPSMASILSGVRKYRLGLTLAHQELRQLEARDREAASAVLSNPYTRVCFRVGDADARKLADGFRHFEASDLQDLSTGQAIARVERADYDFNLSTALPDRVDEATGGHKTERIREMSRSRYGTPKAQVEAALAKEWERHTPRDERTAPPKERLQTDSKETPFTVAAKREPIESDLPVAEIPTSPTPEQETPRPIARKQTKARHTSVLPPLMGKGGQQHKYLQNLIKRWAEGMGYRATIEKPLPDGSGSVDVALEKDDISIAIEICVTTTPEHETGNLKKCLDAGYGYVASVSNDVKKLKALRETCGGELVGSEQERVQFCLPEELFEYVQEMEAQAASREQTVKGYKVKINYSSVDNQEKVAKKRTISRVVLKSLRNKTR